MWGLGVELPPLAWGEELLLGLKAGLVPDRPREGCRGVDAGRPPLETLNPYAAYAAAEAAAAPAIAPAIAAALPAVDFPCS